MFNVGGGELLVIMLVALVVLGPQKLPEAARKVGNAMGELRKLSSGFQAEMRNAISDVDKADGSQKNAKPAAKRDKPTKALKPGTTPEQAATETRATADRADEPIAELAAAEAPAGELSAAVHTAEDAPGDEPAANVEATVAGAAIPGPAAEVPKPGPTTDTAEDKAPGPGPSPVAGNGASADAEPENESAGPASGPRR